MAAGTPGPWRHYSGAIVAKDRTSRSENAIVHVAKVGAFEDKELLRFNGDRWRADAHLIAAAPLMLETLESIYVDLVDYAKRLEGAYSTGAIALSSCADQVHRVIQQAKGKV